MNKAEIITAIVQSRRDGMLGGYEWNSVTGKHFVTIWRTGDKFHVWQSSDFMWNVQLVGAGHAFANENLIDAARWCVSSSEN